MAEYVKKEDVLAKAQWFEMYDGESEDSEFAMKYIDPDDVESIPTADVVEVDKVAEMFYEAFGCDDCPCNYNNIDEWLPLLCGVDSFCGRHDDKLYCWKLFIKHYGARMDGE